MNPTEFNLRINEPAYSAARQTAAFYRQPEAGALRVAGPDRISYFQRQTTNDIRRLEPGRAVVSVLTSPTARILDVLTLLPEPEAITVLPLPGKVEATYRFLKSRIFFNDKVTLENASQATTQVDLIGPRSNAILQSLGAEPVTGLEQVVSFSIEGEPVQAVWPGAGVSLGLRLLVPAAVEDALLAALEASGALRLDPETYDLLRVEAGLPAAGRELTEEYTPLEVNLRSAVSDSKGCYTGQEVIARQITYDKITQQLVGLRLETEAQAGERVLADGKPVGVITSVQRSPQLGPIALAVVRRPANEPGTAVTVGPQAVPAQVTSLPFAAL